MFIIKLLNCILIIGVCAYIGISKANIFSIRVDKLRNLKSGFNIFRTKLEFSYEPIKESFLEISKLIYKEKNNIFKSYVTNLENGNFEEAWELSVAENSYGFSKEDILLINGFGKLLGKTDINGQINEINLADEFLDKQIADAEEKRKKNDKLYKSLGIITGIGIVIICL